MGENEAAKIAALSADSKHLEKDLQRVEEDGKQTAKLAYDNSKNITLMQSAIEETQQEVHIMRSDFDEFRQHMTKEIKEIKDTHYAKAQKDHAFQCEVNTSLHSISEKLDNSVFNFVTVAKFVANNKMFCAWMATIFFLCSMLFMGFGSDIGAIINSLLKIKV